MISSRLLISMIIGVFSLALGVFVLAQDPHRRLNRSYALHNLTMSTWYILVGPITMIPHHDMALLLYRIVQIALPVHTYFLIRFIQDFLGTYHHKSSHRMRSVIMLSIVILVPFYFSPLVVKDFSNAVENGVPVFMREPGPLYPFNLMLFLVLFVIATSTVFRHLRTATGMRRNQTLFIALGISLGLLSILCFFLSMVSIDLSWLYFTLNLGFLFSFAYAISKHQLFDFNVAMRRLAINVGVYAVLVSLPIFIFFPLREWFLSQGELSWILFTAGMFIYAVLFSMAPRFTHYLRQKAEERKWAYLRQQLEFVKESSEKIADETGLSASEISKRVVDVLWEFYWNRMKTPLKFVFSAMIHQDGRPSVTIAPDLNVDESVLNEFLENLRKAPIEFIQNPFSEYDLSEDQWKENDNLKIIKKYLNNNRIEICCPSIHDGKVRGALLLGPKEKGIFWSEELTVLNMLATHAAMAVRKSELLSRNEELKQLDRLKTELISNITHEFKTPLYVVENAIDILIRDMEKHKYDEIKIKDYLLMIKNNAAQLGIFIQNLLEVSRIEQSKVDMHVDEVDLKDIIAKTIQLIKPMADKKNIKLGFVPIDSTIIRCDSHKIYQALANVVSNAVKFTQHGEVGLTINKKDGHILITVKDTGQGIASQNLKAIFEKFYRDSEALKNGKRMKGTGLGLTIAKGWIEAHGGKIWAESDGAGQGSSFYIDLPMGRAA